MEDTSRDRVALFYTNAGSLTRQANAKDINLSIALPILSLSTPNTKDLMSYFSRRVMAITDDAACIRYDGPQGGQKHQNKKRPQQPPQ
jgi:hypothetical protein